MFRHQRLSGCPNVRKVELRDDVTLDSGEHRQGGFKDPAQFGARHFVHAGYVRLAGDGQSRTTPSAK
jgi:hypothetical protein